MGIFKRAILKTNLLEGMTDIHSHLLPGVDDGMQTREDSLEALGYMYELGVKHIYCTPHIMADLKDNTPEVLRTKFSEFAKAAPQGLELRLAAEYMMDAGFEAKIKEGLLTMANRHVLVETSYLSPPLSLMDLLYDLSVNGYIPVIAHPERYMYMCDKDYRKLKESGNKFQLNLFSLAGTYGLPAQKKAMKFLKDGFYDFTGSDIHHLGNYQYSLLELSLSRSQRTELERLLDNNTDLW
ncbi:capsular polysaccharide biosynthesis protein [Bacteroidia bacterium]|nr:capsular polysaccharide biosynthesis protein [Bacteroidia bacterium]